MRDGTRFAVGPIAWIITQTVCWIGLALAAVRLTQPAAVPLTAVAAAVALGGSAVRLAVAERRRRLVTDLESLAYAGVVALAVATPVGWWRLLALFGVGAAKVVFAASEDGGIVPLWLLGTCAWLLAGSARPGIAPVVWGWIACGPLLACVDTFLMSGAARPEAVRRAAFATFRLLPVTAVVWALLPARGWAAPGLHHLHLGSLASLGTAAALAPGRVLGAVWRPLVVAGALAVPARILGRRVGSALVAAAAFALLAEVFAPALSLSPAATGELATLSAAAAAKRSAATVLAANVAQAVRSVAQAPASRVLEGAPARTRAPAAPVVRSVPGTTVQAGGSATPGGGQTATVASSATGALVPGTPSSFTFAQVGEMTVTKPLAAVPYLRQQAFATYTGSAWLPGSSDLGGLAGGYWGPGYKETASIRLDGEQDPVAVPWFSTSVNRSGTRFSPDPDWMWFAAPFVAGDQSYTASFVVPDIAAVAAKVARDPADPPPAPGYLQLPAELPVQVRTLADRVVAASGARTPWQRAVALATWLQGAYPYDLVAAPPPGTDWVYYFLFSARAGFCEDFASAMTVMARVEGIPARLVTGYIAPRPTGNQDLYTIWTPTHAWAELYFPAVGWVPFDATSNDVLDPGQLHGPRSAAVGTQDGVWKPLASGEGLRSTAGVKAGAAIPAPRSGTSSTAESKPSPSAASSSQSAGASASGAAAPTSGSAAPRSASGPSGAGGASASAGAASIAPSSSSQRPGPAPPVAAAGRVTRTSLLQSRAWMRSGWLVAGVAVLLAAVGAVTGLERISRTSALGRALQGLAFWRKGRQDLGRASAGQTLPRHRPVAAVIAALAEVVGPRRRQWRTARQSRHQRRQVLRAAARVDTALAAAGRSRSRHQTVAAYWTLATAALTPEVARLLRLFHLARYRSAPLPPGAGKLAAQSAHAATRAIRRATLRRRA